MSKTTLDRQKGHTCKYCLNAYYSPYDFKIRCVNKDFDKQFDPTIDTTVRLDGWCTRWNRRGQNQKPLTIPRIIQLELFTD